MLDLDNNQLLVFPRDRSFRCPAPTPPPHPPPLQSSAHPPPPSPAPHRSVRIRHVKESSLESNDAAHKVSIFVESWGAVSSSLRAESNAFGGGFALSVCAFCSSQRVTVCQLWICCGRVCPPTRTPSSCLFDAPCTALQQVQMIPPSTTTHRVNPHPKRTSLPCPHPPLARSCVPPAGAAAG